MAIHGAKQPSIRHSKAGPFATPEGISFLPKVANFKKTGIDSTGNDDFLALPAGTFIAQAFIRCDTSVSGGAVSLGLVTGGDEALIVATDFDATVADNSAVSSGLYLPDGDTVRLAVTDTPTGGAVSGFLVYYQLNEMENEGVHFEL